MNRNLQNSKYILEKELGQGSFGITYKAINQNINQTVVIKTLNIWRMILTPSKMPVLLRLKEDLFPITYCLFHA